MIRAAIATKRKYGAVQLSDEDRSACEAIAGQKWENMWLSRNESGEEPHALEAPENGKYAILEEEKQKLEAEIAASKAKLS